MGTFRRFQTSQQHTQWGGCSADHYELDAWTKYLNWAVRLGFPCKVRRAHTVESIHRDRGFIGCRGKRAKRQPPAIPQDDGLGGDEGGFRRIGGRFAGRRAIGDSGGSGCGGSRGSGGSGFGGSRYEASADSPHDFCA